jgi:molybdopterin converting factor small subunit
MPARVLFFGATAAVTGERRIELPVEAMFTAGQLFDQLIERYPDLARHKLLLSVNQQYATGEEVIHDGDELAIFTAVSGG